MDKLFSYIVRLVVWFSPFMKPLARLHLCRYDEWRPGQRLKILLVGYNGARNTGADARVVALTQQLEAALGTERMTGHEMNAIISHYVEQLQQMGVHSGDTVALSGINCIDHAAIDQAIGLVGAVSVPIYYTTPADEIALLLRKSATRWFFIGDERINGHFPDIQLIPFGPLKNLPHYPRTSHLVPRTILSPPSSLLSPLISLPSATPRVPQASPRA